MSDRFPEQMLQAGDNNLDPIAGAKLNFYITGTTTRKDTYSDDAKTIPNTNPVVADAAGRFGDIFMDTDVAYKVVYTDAADVVIQTFDPFDPVRATNVVETPVTTKSSNFTVLESERGHLYEIDASAGSINATLLAAATAANNFEIGFKKVDSSTNPVTVDGNGAETIDGATEQTLANQYEVIVLVCDGTTWHIKSDNRQTDAPLPKGFRSAIQFVNGVDNDHDIDIPAFDARDSADAVNISTETDLTKQADAAWTAGTNQGGLSSSLTLTADTDYYIHGIRVGGEADVGYDTSDVAANLIADHSATDYALLGSFRTDGAGNIINNRFMTKTTDGKRYEFNEQATTSGTGVDWEGLDPDIQRLQLVMEGINFSGTDALLVQLGDSGGLETSGYTSTAVDLDTTPSVDVFTTGFSTATAAIDITGSMNIVNISKSDGLTWIADHTGRMDDTGVTVGGGAKTLTGRLDRLRAKPSGANTFTGGNLRLFAWDH